MRRNNKRERAGEREQVVECTVGIEEWDWEAKERKPKEREVSVRAHVPVSALPGCSPVSPLGPAAGKQEAGGQRACAASSV